MNDPTSAPDRSRDVSQPLERLNPAETIKAESDHLRGSIANGLREPITGAVPGDDIQLLKFYGIYQQDDRDLRDERRRQKLEPAYEFMIRLRLPGGVCRPWQWLQLDDLARRYGHPTLRLTTRQTFQFHGILKHHLKHAMQAIDAALLDTLGACGDINRGVLCSPRPGPLHAPMFELARSVSDRLTARTRAYREIWLDNVLIAGGDGAPRPEETSGFEALQARQAAAPPLPPDAVGDAVEPLYGRTYLPRKFKIAFVAPPVNDVDIFAQDLGFIAIEENGVLAGFDVSVGGGLGRTDNDPATYPRLADVIGFCPPERVTSVVEQVVRIQRDFGDRVERKHARFKYTLDDRGLDWFKAELEARLGWTLGPARPYRFHTNCDRFGWADETDDNAFTTLFVENGRIGGRVMDGLREIARIHEGDFRITPNQNLIIAGVSAEKRPQIEALIAEYGVQRSVTPLRQNAMACVALPTCGLAMAESERYLPSLIDKIDVLLAECGLADERITVRMTGCPNGCARPYLAEIGMSGRAPGKYNLYLGGGFHGQRLNSLYLENVGEERILAALAPLLRRYAAERLTDEHFGDFLVRVGEVPEIREGRDFNAPRKTA